MSDLALIQWMALNTKNVTSNYLWYLQLKPLDIFYDNFFRYKSMTFVIF